MRLSKFPAAHIYPVLGAFAELLTMNYYAPCLTCITF